MIRTLLADVAYAVSMRLIIVGIIGGMLVSLFSVFGG